MNLTKARIKIILDAITTINDPSIELLEAVSVLTAMHAKPVVVPKSRVRPEGWVDGRKKRAVVATPADVIAPVPVLTIVDDGSSSSGYVLDGAT